MKLVKIPLLDIDVFPARHKLYTSAISKLGKEKVDEACEKTYAVWDVVYEQILSRLKIDFLHRNVLDKEIK